MNLKELGPKPFCYLGLAAAAFYLIGWLLAIHWDPSWTFGVNTLSDMGISEVEATANTFLVICVVGAAIAEFFTLNKILFSEGADRASGYVMALSLVFLAALGIFNKDFGDGSTHNFCAITFFVLILIAIVLSLVHDIRKRNLPFAGITGILLAIMTVTAVTSNLALTEAICVIGVMAWVISESAKVLMGKT